MFVYVNDLRTQHNKYTDVFVPVYAQTIVKDAFAGTPWQGDAAWTPDQAEAYRDLVTKYITLASLRLLAAVHTVDTTTIVAGSPTERADIAERCIVARAPFCTPPYLKAYHVLLKQVILGNTEGGVVLDQAALEAAALAGSDRPARGPIANVAVGGEDATELVRLRAANAALQQKIDRVPEVVEDGAPTIPLSQLEMFGAMTAAAAAQLQDSKEPGAVVTAMRLAPSRVGTKSTLMSKRLSSQVPCPMCSSCPGPTKRSWKVTPTRRTARARSSSVREPPSHSLVELTMW